ncbi:MAG: M18 family aminopeptidase [Microthrixaceae bacterium]
MSDRAVEDLRNFIDASPTQFHAVHNAAARLLDAGFELFDPAHAHDPGARFVVADGALVAWVDGTRPDGDLRMIGAHTDSPNLRIRPRPEMSVAGFRQLGVEVYGGALLNSWLDRDLGLAGRVIVHGDDGLQPRLFRTERPVLRVPQLAIHLDRDISERGLVLNKQQHLMPVWGLGATADGDFRDWLADQIGVRPGDVRGWDVACFDHQPADLLGADQELLAASRLDNLCSSFGAIEALIAAKWAGGLTSPAAIVLFDHEEVGSTSATGADSTWLARVLERRALALGLDRTAWLASLERAWLLSADMAHATHPNYPERHEPRHWVRLGGGPVIKHNENARYATDAQGAALFRSACAGAGVPVQEYSHRGDLPCGSTIGPLAAAQLAVRTVDVGMAQLSMHSIRELMAAADVATMVTAFTAWLSPR